MSGRAQFGIYSVLFVIYAICAIENARGECDWPSPFTSSTWLDSSQGDVTFTASTLQGWTANVSSTESVNMWACVTSSTFSSDGRIIIRSTGTVNLFSVHYYVYVCLTFTPITGTSYRYYINNKKQENAAQQRVFLYPVEFLTDAGTICDDAGGASGGEYHVMILGDASAAKVKCPWSFLGRYGYTHTTSSNVVTCNQMTSQVDTCTDSTEMKFNYDTCDSRVAYSASDTVWCVDNVNVGGTNYVMLLNGNDADATVDNINVFRFTCMAIAADNNRASVSPRHCQTGQTASQFPVSDGSTIGALLAFDSPTESCPSCSDLPASSLNSITIATSGAVTSATYTCTANYTLHGAAVRTCQDNGGWSPSAPYCSCAVPLAPADGTVTINNEGSQVTYTCLVGFTLSVTSPYRTCQISSATWTGSDPTCTPCAAIASPVGRTYTLQTSGTVTTARFSCRDAYLLIGVQEVTCLPTGQWGNTLPTCVSCDQLTHPASGTVLITGSVAEYSCVSGYSLAGASTRSCQVDGSWSGTAPTCVCNNPPSPLHGAVVADGVTASYSCNVNYTILGEHTRTCQTDGSGWSASDPTCTECMTIPTILGGAVTFTSTGTMTSARFTCVARFTLDGTTPITCLSDGSWSNTIPQCVECPDLPDPNSGTVSIATSGTTSTATYACASGYEINGNTIRLCSAAGTWSLTAPTCTCLAPSAIPDGTVTANGQTANYTCLSGTSLRGVAQRTCASDGSGWSGTAPTCTTCDTIVIPAGGSVTTSTDGITTQASFTCVQGATLAGAPLLTCRSDGTWDYNIPQCSECPTLENPASGTVTSLTSGTLTTATFSCTSGYYISGAITLTCRTDGTWDNNPPTCKCNFPMTPSNGGVSVTDNSQGNVASYTCNKGYSLDGSAMRTCQTDGSGWEGTDPTCSLCATVTAPTSGTYNLTSTGTSTVARFYCDKGSTMSGHNTLICRNDGSYDNDVPTCVSCVALEAPQSGTVTMVTDGFTTTATFMCATGYSLTSTGTLNCTTSGQWSATTPSCDCDPPSQFANGNFLLASNKSTLTYSCDVDYVLTGSRVRHCQTNGQGWSGVDPTCRGVPGRVGAATEDEGGLSIPVGVVVAMAVLLVLLLVGVIVVTYLYVTLRKRNKQIDHAQPDTDRMHWEPKQECSSLQASPGGQIAYSTDGTTTSANFSCTAGYNLAGDGWLTCLVDTSWDLTLPSCVECTELSDPFGGQVTLTTDGHVTSAAYTCPAGYQLVGTSTRTCSLTGTWDLTEPTCECFHPATPMNGDVSANGVTAEYTCDSGYTLIGPQTRSCLSDGTGWSGADTMCTQCSGLADPPGGSYEITSTGSVTSANLTCTVGYTLVGNHVVTCQADGSWETQPTCERCETLPDLHSGEHVQKSDGLVTVADYACAAGYILAGSPFRTCLEDGSWEPVEPTCFCESPAPPQNGTVSDDGSSATYSCHVGFSLSGATTRQCATDGSGWSGTDPLCNNCNMIADQAGRVSSLSTDGTVTQASFSCSVNYTLLGSATSTCNSVGLWDTQHPDCVKCATVYDPASGSVTIVTDGYTPVATFTCGTDYYLSGKTSATCSGIDGHWSSVSPTCKCYTPTSPDDGDVSVSEEAEVQVATYTCNKGFSLAGAHARLCQADGRGWDNTHPTCVPCETLTTPEGGNIKFSTDGTQTFALVTCKKSYTLSGAQNLTCRSDGSWDVTVPTCVSCPSLEVPASGSVVTSTDDYVTTASYSCVTGYYVSGPHSITCGSNGVWSQNPPTCRCNIPAAPADGSVSVSDGVQGQEANYMCSLGYSMAGSSTRLCQENGQGWESTDPSCTECPAITTQPDVIYSRATNGTTTAVVYTCPLNYTLDGVSRHTCDGTTGAWDHPTPTCQLCADLHAPRSGSVDLSTSGLSTVATFSCVFGYSLNSTAVTTCLTDGSWDIPVPACVCNPPPAVANGQTSLSTDGRAVNHSCDAGYQLVGSQRRFCADDGTGWNGTAPRCDLLSALNTGAATEEEPTLSLHLAVFIVMLVIILVLAVALGLFLYFRGKVDRSKISATFESGSNSSQPIEEKASDLNAASDAETGSRSALISGNTDKNFNVRKLTPNDPTSRKSLPSGSPAVDTNPLTNGSLPDPVSETTVISMPNGSAQHVPIQSVRLPKLPPRQTHQVPKPKSKSPTKRKRKPHSEKHRHSGPRTSTPADQSRTLTPLEVQMSRTKTPEVLESAEFEYIAPQYCYEVDTPVTFPESQSGTSVRPGTSGRAGTSRPPTSFSEISAMTAAGVQLDIERSRSAGSSSNDNAKSCQF